MKFSFGQEFPPSLCDKNVCRQFTEIMHSQYYSKIKSISLSLHFLIPMMASSVSAGNFYHVYLQCVLKYVLSFMDVDLMTTHPFTFNFWLDYDE